MLLWDGKAILLENGESFIAKTGQIWLGAGMKTAQSQFLEIKHRLKTGGIEEFELETRILFEDLAGITPSIRVSLPEIPLPEDISANLDRAVDRRLNGEPIGRILGYRDFWKSRFYLSPDTLEPRPDTETLIEEVLRVYKGQEKRPLKLIDLGTGTGCILLSLLQEFPEATGLGIDISAGAVEQARDNAKRLGLEKRAEFRLGSWLDGIEAGRKFDMILSNPPYIPSSDIPNLSKEVQNYDPLRALDGGKEGLDPYTNLLPILKNYLEPDAHVFFEFGINQESDIVRLVEEARANLIRVTRDLGGVPRVVTISYGDK